MLYTNNFKNWFLINKVLKCNFYGFAFPGDQVELEVTSVAGSTPDTRQYRGVGTVRGKKKIAVDFEGTLVSLEDLEDSDEQRRFFSRLTRESQF